MLILLSRVYLCIITAGIFRRFRMPSTVVTPDLRHAFTAYSSVTTLSALGQKTTPPFWPSLSTFHGWLAACRLPIRSRMCWPNTRAKHRSVPSASPSEGAEREWKCSHKHQPLRELWRCFICGSTAILSGDKPSDATLTVVSLRPSEEKWCSMAADWDRAHSGLRV